MRFRVDVSEHSAVGVCTTCGFRCLAADRTDALGQLAGHELAAHPTSRNASAHYSRARHAGHG